MKRNGGSMDLLIHVEASSEEVHNKLVEYLAENGVDFVVGEKDALVAGLFLQDRRNRKLDNLGQLRHLYNIRASIHAIAKGVESVAQYASMVVTNNAKDHLLKRRYIDAKCEYDPTLLKRVLQENPWLANKDEAVYLSWGQIYTYFGE